MDETPDHWSWVRVRGWQNLWGDLSESAVKVAIFSSSLSLHNRVWLRSNYYCLCMCVFYVTDWFTTFLTVLKAHFCLEKVELHFTSFRLLSWLDSPSARIQFIQPFLYFILYFGTSSSLSFSLSLSRQNFPPNKKFLPPSKSTGKKKLFHQWLSLILHAH